MAHETPAVFCPRCGAGHDAGDAFCRKCGTPLAAPAVESKPPAATTPPRASAPTDEYERTYESAEARDRDVRRMRANGWAMLEQRPLPDDRWVVRYGLVQDAGASIAPTPLNPRGTAPAKSGPPVLMTLAIVLAVVAGGIWLMLQLAASMANNATRSLPVNQRPAIQPSTSITYTVTGGGGVAKASLTYENAQGGTEQEEVSSLPWSKSFTVRPGSFVYVSAQNTSNVSGTIACEITANGTSFKRSQSSGVATIASCNGSAP